MITHWDIAFYVVMFLIVGTIINLIAPYKKMFPKVVIKSSDKSKWVFIRENQDQLDRRIVAPRHHYFAPLKLNLWFIALVGKEKFMSLDEVRIAAQIAKDAEKLRKE